MDEKDNKSDCDCPFDGKDTLIPTSMPGLCIRHTVDHQTSLGMIVPVREGMSIPDTAHMVEQEEDGTLRVGQSIAQMKAGNGPAQVATPEYRSNWDRTFGKTVVGIA